MSNQTENAQQTRLDKAIDKTTTLLTSKRTRSVVLLIISLFFIFMMNALLPVVEGDTHYTASAVQMSYSDYLDAKEDNNNFRLTWKSQQDIQLYIDRYIDSHPELTEAEQMLVTVPDAFKVDVYTKFFFEHPFWYVATATSIGSSLILFYSLFHYLITRAKDRYDKYIKLDRELDKLAEEKLDPVTFEPWMEESFNRRRKINQHKANVKYMIDKLERKTSYKIKRKLKPYFDLVHNLDGTIPASREALTTYRPNKVLEDLGLLSKQETKYLRTKERYIALLEDSYINEYVINGRVKYFKYIYPIFIYNGENAVGRTIDNYSLIKTDAKRISSDAASKAALTVTITLLFAVFLTVTVVSSYQQEPIWVVINAISKIAPLFIQIPLAIDYSNQFMNTHLIGNLINRRSIALLYLAETYQKRGEVLTNATQN